MLLDHLVRDEALALGPVGVGTVQRVPQLELFGVARGQVVQLGLEENVVFGLKLRIVG